MVFIFNYFMVFFCFYFEVLLSFMFPFLELSKKQYFIHKCLFHFYTLNIFKRITLSNRTSLMVLVVKNPPANAGYMSCWLNPWVWKTPGKRAWQPTLVFLPGEFLEQKATVHGVAESWTWLKRLTMLTCKLSNNV